MFSSVSHGGISVYTTDTTGEHEQRGAMVSGGWAFARNILLNNNYVIIIFRSFKAGLSSKAEAYTCLSLARTGQTILTKQNVRREYLMLKIQRGSVIPDPVIRDVSLFGNFCPLSLRSLSQTPDVYQATTQTNICIIQK